MSLVPPRTLSPSKVATFCECALAFRFSAIDRLPDPPSTPAVRGTVVHTALERLFVEPPEQRSVDRALAYLAKRIDELTDEEREVLAGDDGETDGASYHDAERRLRKDAEKLVRHYFKLENPEKVHAIGLELGVAADIGGVRVRGIIDRLELDDDGALLVTDYKTGRPPTERNEQSRLTGVEMYALLCERMLGVRPARVQLLYLGTPLAIVATPSEQSLRATERKLGAVWAAVERACRYDNFRPRTSRLCNYCAFRAYCPAFGGDPEEAVTLRKTTDAASPPAPEPPTLFDAADKLHELAAAR